MRDAGVVRREVTHHLEAAVVRGRREPSQGRRAAEEGVDLLEGRCVVPVVGSAREERRQVDDVDAQGLQVVQMLGDPVEVAAVELVRDALAAEVDRV